VEVIFSSLPFGVGGGGVASALNTITGRYVEAHNVALSILVQFGLLGAAFLVALGASIARCALVIRYVPAVFALVLVVVCFSQMLSLEYRAFFWVVILMVFKSGGLMKGGKVRSMRPD
jgi:NADH:ubiquinone oxidoreductase subunit 6 (subunit J)